MQYITRRFFSVLKSSQPASFQIFTLLSSLIFSPSGTPTKCMSKFLFPVSTFLNLSYFSPCVPLSVFWVTIAELSSTHGFSFQGSLLFILAESVFLLNFTNYNFHLNSFCFTQLPLIILFLFFIVLFLFSRWIL